MFANVQKFKASSNKAIITLKASIFLKTLTPLLIYLLTKNYFTKFIKIFMKLIKIQDHTEL